MTAITMTSTPATEEPLARAGTPEPEYVGTPTMEGTPAIASRQ